MINNHLEIKMHCHGSFQKSPVFSRIFYSMPIEALSRFWNAVDHPAECRTFQNPCIDLYLAYDIIVAT